MSQAIVTSRELRNKDTQIDLSVPDYHEVPGLLTNDEVFHVIVISSRPYFKTIRHKKTDTVQFMVEKKYGEFEALHKSLSDRFPATVFPELPRKLLMLKDSTPQERRASFDNFMKFVASNPKVAISSQLLAFLGVKADRIKQVEQMALDEAEAAKADIIKKDEKGQDEGDGASQVTSQQRKKPSVGLFDDLPNEDLDLFEDNSINEEEQMKAILEESDGLFGSSPNSSKESGAGV